MSKTSMYFRIKFHMKIRQVFWYLKKEVKDIKSSIFILWTYNLKLIKKRRKIIYLQNYVNLYFSGLLTFYYEPTQLLTPVLLSIEIKLHYYYSKVIITVKEKGLVTLKNILRICNSIT